MTRRFIPYCRGCGFLLVPKENNWEGFTGCRCRGESNE